MWRRRRRISPLTTRPAPRRPRISGVTWAALCSSGHRKAAVARVGLPRRGREAPTHDGWRAHGRLSWRRPRQAGSRRAGQVRPRRQTPVAEGSHWARPSSRHAAASASVVAGAEQAPSEWLGPEAAPPAPQGAQSSEPRHQQRRRRWALTLERCHLRGRVYSRSRGPPPQTPVHGHIPWAGREGLDHHREGGTES